LHFLKYLSTLNMCHNRIGDDGATRLAASFLSMQRDVTLDLRENEISGQVASALASKHQGAFHWE
jgi:Ran GTPase-activating protein (RanGAP) involved in mRNA processing and transport